MSNMVQTQHALYMFTKTFTHYKDLTLSAEKYSDGIPFAIMLASVDNFGLKIQQLQQKCQKWSTKLTNLKKIIQKLQHFVQTQYQKSLKLDDLQLVQISKNNSIQEILKFFQVVISVLMQTPQKEDYIQAIMSLDERSQQALVVIVQNAMEFRLCDLRQSEPLNAQKMHRIETQNKILSEQITQLCNQNQGLHKNNQTLKKRLQECQQQIQKARNLHLQMYMQKSNNQQQNRTIQLLKTKMIQLSREHQIEITKISDQNYHLKSQIAHFRQLQEQYKDKIEACELKIGGKDQQSQNQRKLLLKNLQEKQAKLRKYEYQLEIARSKIRQLSQDLQVTDLNMRMELQKKQVRFKQLQKQVKTRLIDTNQSGQKHSKQSHITDQEDELQYLKLQVQKLRNNNRQLQRQNLKAKKKLQKTLIVQNQKKKLQRIILDVSKSRDEQIEMLVVCLYDLRNQNIRMHSIIKELQSNK